MRYNQDIKGFFVCLGLLLVMLGLSILLVGTGEETEAEQENSDTRILSTDRYTVKDGRTVIQTTFEKKNMSREEIAKQLSLTEGSLMVLKTDITYLVGSDVEGDYKQNAKNLPYHYILYSDGSLELYLSKAETEKMVEEYENMVLEKVDLLKELEAFDSITISTDYKKLKATVTNEEAVQEKEGHVSSLNILLNNILLFKGVEDRQVDASIINPTSKEVLLEKTYPNKLTKEVTIN